MRNMLKRTLMAFGMALMLLTPMTVNAEEACSIMGVESYVEKLYESNDGLFVEKAFDMNTAEDKNFIYSVLQNYNNTPPFDQRIEPGEVVSATMFDKPGVSQFLVAFYGRDCFLGSMIIHKADPLLHQMSMPGRSA